MIRARRLGTEREGFRDAEGYEAWLARGRNEEDLNRANHREPACQRRQSTRLRVERLVKGIIAVMRSR